MASTKRISFQFEPAPPFRLDLTAWVLRRRPDNVVDRWDGENYRRVIVIEGEPVEVTATQSGDANAAQLQVGVMGEALPPNAESTAKSALERLLGVDIDLKSFYKFAQRDKRLKPLMQRFRGFKPTRFLTLYEALVNGITCQQLSLTIGILTLNRLATTFGRAFQAPQGPVHAFPQPSDLLNSEPQALRKLGYSRQKACALLELSRGIVDGQVSLETLETMTDDAVLKYLDNLRGVGRWTAEYVLLRGLGRLHVFPADDVGVRRNLERWLNLQESLDYESTRHVLARWKPYAGLVYFHLLLNGLTQGGYIR